LVGEETHYDSEAIPTVAALQNLNDKGKVLAEPEQFGRKTVCCGAGGGRMWMDESPDQRPSDRRMKQLLATGAHTVAVACPFCRIMLDSAVHSNADTPIRLLDLAEVLAEANIEKVGAVYGQTDVESTSETLAEGEAA
jgi:Fe-S oxidoreductase